MINIRETEKEGANTYLSQSTGRLTFHSRKKTSKRDGKKSESEKWPHGLPYSRESDEERKREKERERESEKYFLLLKLSHLAC